MSLLTLTDLIVRRDECPVVDRVSLTIAPGECVGLIGPNGAGKTTLMRAALGLLPFSGHSSLIDMDRLARARRAAWLPQTREIAWPVDVETVVSLGRLPHGRTLSGLTAEDRSAVDQALERMDLSAFRHRTATRLSGGEQARVLIARALAQEAPLLLADEPIAGLDPAHQIAAMGVFAQLAREGRAIVTALHDLGLAARHCTRLLIMHQGRLVADGRPEEVLTPDNLRSVFGVTGHFAKTEAGDIFVPLETLL